MPIVPCMTDWFSSSATAEKRTNGSAVFSPSQARQALADTKSQGKHDVLVKVKTRTNSVFVAIPLAQS